MNNTEYLTVDGLPQSVVDFLRYLDVVQNKSSNTVVSYALDLRMFLRFTYIYKGSVDKKTPFDQIDISSVTLDYISSLTLDDAYAFLGYCKNTLGNSARSRARRTVSIRRFFDFLYGKKKLIPANPMDELDSPKLEKNLPKFLTLDQSVTLLDCVDGKFKERDYAILVLFLNCGMRLSELVGLDVNDIHSDDTMTVTGKGSKQRTVYLNEASKNAVEAWLLVRPRDGNIDKNALFISARGNRISPKSVQHIVYSALDKAGLSGKGFSVHKLRHTAATLMYRYGNVDILALKEILGHENVGTTQIYTHISNDQLRSAVDSNPLAKVAPDKNKNKNKNDDSDQNDHGDL